MPPIGDNLAWVRERIARACVRSGRDPSEVRLLAVSKTVEAERIQEAFEAGQTCFGESRQQEAADKVASLPGGIEWHFIGGLQRNKVRKVLGDFQVIHSIDSWRLADHVDRIAGELGVRPAVFLEVDLADQASKGGFSPEELENSLPRLAALEHLELQGLMVIPPAVDEPELARPWFARARELRDRLRQQGGRALPELSMGMSGDFEIAIEEGSNIVRVGSAIFGEREYRT